MDVCIYGDQGVTIHRILSFANGNTKYKMFFEKKKKRKTCKDLMF